VWSVANEYTITYYDDREDGEERGSDLYAEYPVSIGNNGSLVDGGGGGGVAVTLGDGKVTSTAGSGASDIRLGGTGEDDRVLVGGARGGATVIWKDGTVQAVKPGYLVNTAPVASMPGSTDQPRYFDPTGIGATIRTNGNTGGTATGGDSESITWSSSGTWTADTAGGGGGYGAGHSAAVYGNTGAPISGISGEANAGACWRDPSVGDTLVSEWPDPFPTGDFWDVAAEADTWNTGMARAGVVVLIPIMAAAGWSIDCIEF